MRPAHLKLLAGARSRCASTRSAPWPRFFTGFASFERFRGPAFYLSFVSQLSGLALAFPSQSHCSANFRPIQLPESSASRNSRAVPLANAPFSSRIAPSSHCKRGQSGSCVQATASVSGRAIQLRHPQASPVPGSTLTLLSSGSPSPVSPSAASGSGLTGLIAAGTGDAAGAARFLVAAVAGVDSREVRTEVAFVDAAAVAAAAAEVRERVASAWQVAW